MHKNAQKFDGKTQSEIARLKISKMSKKYMLGTKLQESMG